MKACGQSLRTRSVAFEIQAQTCQVYFGLQTTSTGTPRTGAGGNLRFINETCLYTYHAHKHARNAKCNVVYCCFLLILVVWTCQIATVHSCFILLRMVEKVNQANGHEDDAYWLHDWAPESSEFTWYHVRKRNNYCPYGKMMKLYWGLL